MTQIKLYFLNTSYHIYVSIAILAVLTVACDQNPTKTNASTPVKPAKIDLSLTGEELFIKHCKLCHGVKGNLQLNGAKDLKESTLTLEERINIITTGKNAMTPFEKVLSEEEIRKVAEYSQTFAK